MEREIKRFLIVVLELAALTGRGPTNAAADPWAPPEPQTAERDWVMLTSGEWLWGDITLFRDEELSFDSENLDDLVLDWDDVAVIRSSRILTYTFLGERVASGTASMRDGVIRIRTTDGVEEYPKSDLLKIIEGELREINFWSLKASLGLTARAGNTDQTDLNNVLKLRREATRSRIDLDYNGNYSHVDSVRIVDNHRLAASWDIIITRGLFISPFLGEFYRDEFQNIDYRATVGAGVGLWMVRGGDLDWNVSIAGSYRHTQYASVEAGEDDRDRTGAVVPATTLEWDVTSDIELDASYNAQIGIPEVKNTTHHLQSFLSVDVWGDTVDITMNFTWDRVETPRTNADGITPKRDDYRLALGIGVDL